MKGLRRQGWWALALVLVAGCQAAPKRMEALDGTLQIYDQAVRWGRIEAVYGFLRPDAEQPTEIPERFRRIRVTGYDIVQPPLMSDELHCTQVVEIRYYDTDYAREQTVLDRQRWEYDEAQQRWYLVSGPPPF